MSDASSVIVEAMMLDKPVVTYCNTMPGPHLLNVTETDAVEDVYKRQEQNGAGAYFPDYNAGRFIGKINGICNRDTGCQRSC